MRKLISSPETLVWGLFPITWVGFCCVKKKKKKRCLIMISIHNANNWNIPTANSWQQPGYNASQTNRCFINIFTIHLGHCFRVDHHVLTWIIAVQPLNSSIKMCQFSCGFGTFWNVWLQKHFLIDCGLWMDGRMDGCRQSSCCSYCHCHGCLTLTVLVSFYITFIHITKCKIK